MSEISLFGLGRGIGEINTELLETKVKNIYQEYKNKDITQKQLAEKYNVSSTSVGYIVNKKHSLFRDDILARIIK